TTPREMLWFFGSYGASRAVTEPPAIMKTASAELNSRKSLSEGATPAPTRPSSRAARTPRSESPTTTARPAYTARVLRGSVGRAGFDMTFPSGGGVRAVRGEGTAGRQALKRVQRSGTIASGHSAVISAACWAAEKRSQTTPFTSTEVVNDSASG